MRIEFMTLNNECHVRKFRIVDTPHQAVKEVLLAVRLPFERGWWVCLDYTYIPQVVGTIRATNYVELSAA